MVMFKPTYKAAAAAVFLVFGILGSVSSLAQLSLGNIFVIDNEQFTGVQDLLFRVDPATSTRTVVSDFHNPVQGEEGFTPIKMAVDAAGNVLVLDTAHPRSSVSTRPQATATS